MSAAHPVTMTYLYPDMIGPEWPCDPQKLARAVGVMVATGPTHWNRFSILLRLSDGSSTVLKPKKRRA